MTSTYSHANPPFIPEGHSLYTNCARPRHIFVNMGNSSSTPKISAQDRSATMSLSTATITLLTPTKGLSLT
ncbi:hypothetical protein KCU63_g18060, partial [Aureobasidium melanogenum]